jgi:alpha-tubulin suppressor-like RCC1 family protein
MHRIVDRGRGVLLALMALVVAPTMAVAGPASATSPGGVFSDNLASPPGATVPPPSSNILAWGSNKSGALGHGEALRTSNVPVPVNGLSGVTAVAASGNGFRGGFSLALLTNGTVMAWGNDYAGGLGDGEDGEEAKSDVPVPVSELSGVTAIAAGSEHALALLSNGTVMAWGDNLEGQLGDGNKGHEASDVPVPVSELSGVTAIAAGGDHSLALLSNGTVMAWGNGDAGELGNGSEAKSNVPVPVSGLSGVMAIATGDEDCFALLEDGTVMAWGENDSGQLGDGQEGRATNSDVPVPVSGLSGVMAVSAGDSDTLALVANGTVMAWGANGEGQLGNGTRSKTGSDVPVPVSALSGVTAISAGSFTNLALLRNGTAMAWGTGSEGQLGDGSSGFNDVADVPVAVKDLGGVTAISAGGAHEVAISALPRVTAVEPAGGPFVGGTRVQITGVNFTEATAVAFGSRAATRVKVRSPTSITTVSPVGSGVADVTVTNPGGTSEVVPADRFSYEPTITELRPNFGRPDGGSAVRIFGRGLTGATSVMFGSKPATKIFDHSGGPLIAVAPAGTGVVDVTVKNPGGKSEVVPADRFSYQPTVTGVRADFGRPAGGGRVTVAGTNFFRVGGVSFGSKPARRFVVDSPTRITAIPPAGSGTVHVTVTGPGGTSASSTADLFAYGIRGQFAITPTPELQTSGHLNAVSCVSLGFCAAVGSQSALGDEALIENWNGTAWSTIAAPPTPTGSSVPPFERIADTRLEAVSCTSASFCVAVGSGAQEGPSFDSTGPFWLLDTWNGTAWSEAPELRGLPGQSELNGVSCASSNFCVAVGQSYATIGKDLQGSAVEQWNGETWSHVKSPYGELNDVSCVSVTFCMAIGRTSLGGEIEINSWNGTNWSVVPSPSVDVAEAVLSGVSCTSVQRCVAVGFDEDGALLESWNGTAWSVLEAPRIAPPVELLHVSCLSTTCVAVGGEETPGVLQTLVVTSIGSNWATVPSANVLGANTLLYGVSCVPSQQRPSCFSVGAAKDPTTAPAQALAETGKL